MKMFKFTAILLSVVLLVSSSIYGAIYANEICLTYYPDGCSNNNNKRSAYPSMGQLIVEGAGYFLKSHSDVLLFLNKVELSEVNDLDYNAIRETLYSAIENMEKSKIAYTILKEIASVTPYNPFVIEALIHLDYDGLRKKNQLNPLVFDRVANFLKKGDVNGVYHQLYLQCETLLDILYKFKIELDADILPDISNIWRLNQRFAESLLFGQYIAEVFHSIKY